MAFRHDHPFPGQSHPWTDPLAPLDLLNPRPDWAFAVAGTLAPAPEHFPMTEVGKRAYYAAVESAARQQMELQQHAATQQAAAEEQAAFVLLLAAGGSSSACHIDMDTRAGSTGGFG